MISPLLHPVLHRPARALQHLVIDPLHPELADADVWLQLLALSQIRLLGQSEMTDDVGHRRPGQIDPFRDLDHLDPGELVERLVDRIGGLIGDRAHLEAPVDPGLLVHGL